MADEYKDTNSPEVINKEEEFSIEDYLFIINRRKWVVIIICLVILVLGMLYTNSKTRIYASACEIYTNRDKNQNVYGQDQLMAIANIANMSSNSTEMITKLICNPDNMEEAFNLLSNENKQNGFDGKMPTTGVVVNEVEKGGRIFNVIVNSKDPTASANLANNLALLYFEKEAKNFNDYSNIAQVQIKEEIDKILVQIDEVRDKIVGLKQQTGIYSIDNDVRAQVSNKYNIENQINQAEVDLASLQSQYDEALRAYNNTPKNLVTESQQSVSSVRDINKRLDELTTERNELLLKFTPNSREVKDVDDKIAFEKSKMQDAEADKGYVEKTHSITYNRDPLQRLQSRMDDLRIQIQGKKTSIARLNALLAKTNQNLKVVPANENELAKVMEQYQLLKDNLALLQSNYYRLVFNSQSDYNIGRIISKAIPHSTPVSPNLPKSFVIYLIAGLILGGFAALLTDNLDNIVYDDSSMKKITTLPCLSKIPLINTNSTDRLQIGKLTGHSNFLEAFRIFRNNIMLTEIMSETQGIDKNKSFAITGPDVKQGKSTTAANLAIAMALDGNEVLLVDADLRKPNVAKFFNVPNDVGYTTLVKGTTTLEEAIKPSGVEHLDLLTSGPLPPNPTEFLNSEENRNMVTKLQNAYDIVIFDTSPCSFISDAQIVTTFVDAVVLVITVKTTRIPIVKTAIEQLNLVKAPIIGYVLNKVQSNQKRRGYYYNYYYYASDDKE
ncbi:MAG: polysaccharide biosynthesis tyrosine autokinase [Abditibacteriota bacterium]|nr:polysaccharide biosynthesis tyrosine autokinase [Abditibacteriota bacterium]